MKSPKEAIAERIPILEKIVREKEMALRKAPEGHLRINRSKRGVQYYLRKSAKDGNGTYLPASSPLISRLAQKGYDEKALIAAKKELHLLQSLEKRYPETTIETILSGLSDERIALIKPLYLPDDLFVKEWLSQQDLSQSDPDETYPFVTNRGEHVRSKSELIIANTLAHRNIPYLYEFPLELSNGNTIHPDFMALNTRLRKTFFWEHLGRMDDSGYVETNLDRLINLENTGFYPGKNLILTFETRRRPLSTKMIENQINIYLI